MKIQITSVFARPHLALLGLLLTLAPMLPAAEKIKALIVDGQNNHKVWPKSTVMMKHYLDATGLFEVNMARTQFIWSAEREAAFLPLANAGKSELVKEPQVDPDFKPDFAIYAVVISHFGWKTADWPEATQRVFEEYVASDGSSTRRSDMTPRRSRAWDSSPPFCAARNGRPRARSPKRSPPISPTRTNPRRSPSRLSPSPQSPNLALSALLGLILTEALPEQNFRGCFPATPRS